MPRDAYSAPLNIENGKIELIHGGGGRAMEQLIDQLFKAEFIKAGVAGNDGTGEGPSHDATLVTPPPGQLAVSTDSHVITPLFFPGGNIGSLAVHGTVNDLAMGGAKPLWLSAGFILEEGFPLKELQTIVRSMAAAAKEAEVKIITGDTKVVEKGKGDGVYINTCGIGHVINQSKIGPQYIQPGDKILISGFLGDHGVAVMSQRENLGFESEILSDSQSLNGLVAEMLEAVPQVHCLRDPTRGGLANTLNELVQSARCDVLLQEATIPLRPAVNGACEFLGLDPLYVANEGKLIAICSAEDADKLLQVMHNHPKGESAAIIGEFVAEKSGDNFQGYLEMETPYGGKRLLDWLNGEQLPRIC
ncbi:hydrogenase expression/formation protein HypE [Pelagibaculum spongiae]|uniref:Hydrogenase expression/formation protein HypE n=1 Tax=Pelagibaculum spongiae TaxID=2080658 RepID=A0A2V1GZQ0_9GAMM|nr:hydrogenase expression/formation protein HypE [Pelagibaculum spongiae]PVZ68801.1 hydrogenase expression/formation protein HypE [Pelagibaculum spongiae]